MPRSDKARSDKLHSLMRLLSHREELAQRALAERQLAASGAAEQARELAALRHEYAERLQRNTASGARAADVRLWRQFNRSLCEVADVQDGQVERLAAELARAQAACLAARARRRAGELLNDAQHRRLAVKERRREQRQAADAAASRKRRS